MANKYFDKSLLVLYDGDVAYANDVNSVSNAIETGFDVVVADFAAIATDQANTIALARSWAIEAYGTEPDGTSYPGEYSAKHHATHAEHWATDTGTVVTDEADYSAKEYAIGDLTASGGSAKAWAIDAASPNGTTEKSAKTLATEAAASAAAALTSETNSAASETAAALSETNAAASETAAALSETNAAASESAASTSETNAAASAASAAASAASLPNTTAAGADKFLQTNATGDGWDYHTASEAVTALGFSNPILDKASPGAIGGTTPDTGDFSRASVAAYTGTPSTNSTVATGWYIPALHDSDKGLAAKRAGLKAANFIAVESTAIKIYDMTGAAPVLLWSEPTALGGASSVVMRHGQLVVGHPGGGLYLYDFIKDKVDQYHTSGRRDRGGVNDNLAVTGPWESSKAIINNTVNAIALTWLNTSPIDPETGLVELTVAVATNGGVSHWLQGEAPKDITCANATYTYCRIVDFDEDNRLWFNLGPATVNTEYLYVMHILPSADDTLSLHYKTGTTQDADAIFRVNGGALSDVNLPGTSNQWVAVRNQRCCTSEGMYRIAYNPTDPTKSTVSHTTTTYNTGEMTDNTLGAYMCTSETGNVTGSELVLTGDFSADTDWIDYLNGSDGSVVISGGVLTITQGTTSKYMGAYQAIDVTGIDHVTAKVETKTASSRADLQTLGFSSTTSPGSTPDIASTTSSALGVLTVSADVSAYSTIYLFLIDGQAAGANSTWDDASARQAIPDRYVTNNGAAIHTAGTGQLTYTRFGAMSLYGGWASGANEAYAEVVDVSGYASSTLFIHPFPLVVAPNSATEHMVNIAYHSGAAWVGAYLRSGVDASGQLFVTLSDDGAATADTITGPVVDDSAEHIVTVWFDGTTLYMRVDGVEYSVAQTNAANGLTTLDSAATLLFGRQQNTSSPFPATNCQFGAIKPTTTIPSTEDIERMEAQVHAFLNASEAVIDGTSDSVLALDHDPRSGLTGAATSSGITYFDQYGVQSSTDTNAVGTPQSISMFDYNIGHGGTTGAKVERAAKNLYEKEIERSGIDIVVPGTDNLRWPSVWAAKTSPLFLNAVTNNPTWDGSNLLWTGDLLINGAGQGVHFAESGYFTMDSPTSGTIKGVGGASDKTCTASGIPLGILEVLYYIPPIGKNYAFIQANFRVVKYGSDYVIPPHWIFVAAVDGLGGVILGTGGYLPKWNTPTLLNSWVDVVAGREARYSKDNSGLVRLKGGIKSGTLATAAFTLPAGFRPGGTKFFAQNSNSAFGSLYIDTSGNVIPENGSALSFYLDGITFQAEA